MKHCIGRESNLDLVKLLGRSVSLLCKAKRTLHCILRILQLLPQPHNLDDSKHKLQRMQQSTVSKSILAVGTAGHTRKAYGSPVVKRQTVAERQPW